MPVSRRGLLAGTAVAGAALAVPGTASAAPSAPAGAKIGPGDARYQDLVTRGQNRRFVGTPDYIRVIRSPQDAVAAVQEAVRSGKRIAVRGGGHCFEDFVDSSDIEVLVLYPVAVQLKAFGTFALVETAVFVALLFVAFIYVWRRGALEWR